MASALSYSDDTDSSSTSSPSTPRRSKKKKTSASRRFMSAKEASKAACFQPKPLAPRPQSSFLVVDRGELKAHVEEALKSGLFVRYDSEFFLREGGFVMVTIGGHVIHVCETTYFELGYSLKNHDFAPAVMVLTKRMELSRKYIIWKSFMQTTPFDFFSDYVGCVSFRGPLVHMDRLENLRIVESPGSSTYALDDDSLRKIVPEPSSIKMAFSFEEACDLLYATPDPLRVKFIPSPEACDDKFFERTPFSRVDEVVAEETALAEGKTIEVVQRSKMRLLLPKYFSSLSVASKSLNVPLETLCIYLRHTRNDKLFSKDVKNPMYVRALDSSEEVKPDSIPCLDHAPFYDDENMRKVLAEEIRLSENKSIEVVRHEKTMHFFDVRAASRSIGITMRDIYIVLRHTRVNESSSKRILDHFAIVARAVESSA